MVDRSHPVRQHAGVEQRPGHTDPIEHLEAAGVHQDRPGLGRRRRQLVDDPHPDAAPGQLARRDEPDRPGPDDQHVCIHESPSG
jgi:hypothetical protein